MKALVRLSAALLLSGFSASSLAQEVTLPLESYESLRRRANPGPEPDPGPPAPFAIEGAEIEVHPASGSARVIHRLSIRLYAPGWQEIPLPAAGTVTSIELRNLEGRISEGDERKLIVRGVGSHTVTFETVIPLVADDSAARPTRSLSFPLPRAAVVTGLVDLTAGPAEMEEVAIVSGALSRGPNDSGRFAFVGAPGALVDLRLLGARRAPERAGLPLEFDADSATLATLGRTRTEVSAFVSVQVLQGRLESLRLSIPRELEVVRVDAGEGGWRLDQGSIVIAPPAPVEDQLSVLVVLQGSSLEELEAPLLVPLGATRATYTTGLVVDADGIPTVLDPGSARPAEEADLASLPPAFWMGAARVYRVRDPNAPPRWSIQWSDAGQQRVLAAQVDRLVVDVLIGRAGRAAYQLWAFVRTSGASSLTIQPPPGFELTLAERDGSPVTPGTTADGLEVPLGGGTKTQSIRVTGVMPFAILPERNGEILIPIPSISAPIGRADLRAVLPGEKNYSLVGSYFESGSLQASFSPFIFRVPAGFAVVEASWVLLTSSPKALTLAANSKKERRKWF